MEYATRNFLLRQYFLKGYTNSEIRGFLKQNDNIEISERQIRRCLTSLGLYRRGHVDPHKAIDSIKYESSRSARSLGYRGMQMRILNRHGFLIPRDTVSDIQKALYPGEVQARRRHVLTRITYFNHVPNYLIHVDGYDKLKRYGFAINATICGYSRRVLWRKVAETNNDPRVVGAYYLQYVWELQGVPRCIRCDNGTENGIMEDLQRAFR